MYIPFPPPYTRVQDGFCKVNESECGARISMYVNTAPGNETSLMMAIAERGPISVAIDASHKSFNFYSHGVYYEPACGECGWLVRFCFYAFSVNSIVTISHAVADPGKRKWGSKRTSMQYNIFGGLRQLLVTHCAVRIGKSHSQPGEPY